MLIIFNQNQLTHSQTAYMILLVHLQPDNVFIRDISAQCRYQLCIWRHLLVYFAITGTLTPQQTFPTDERISVILAVR